MVLTVNAEGDRLFAQMTGQPRFQIFPKGNDEFYWKVVEARIRFLRNENCEVSHAIHYQGGRELDVNKLTEINTIQVNPSVMEKYVGKYEYEPNVILSITANEGKLFVQSTNQNKIELFPLPNTEFFAKEMDASLKFIPDRDNAYKIELRIGPNVRTISKVK